MSPSAFPLHNRILAALPIEAQQRLLPALVQVQLERNQVLHEAGSRLHHAYFPADAIVSLGSTLASGATCEIAMVGNEGFIGASICTGVRQQAYTAAVQRAGVAYRLPAQDLLEEFSRCGDFSRLSLRYTLVLITQITLTAACNRFHDIDQQLCRWLLTMLDHVPGDSVRMTHEAIAGLLGVRREGVSGAAYRLQQRGVIRYFRGQITVIDRQALEKSSCECYRIVSDESARLLRPGPVAPAPAYASWPQNEARRALSGSH